LTKYHDKDILQVSTHELACSTHPKSWCLHV